MTATYTFDVFSSLDGYGAATGWPGYWGKQGPELFEHRLAQQGGEQRMVLGRGTYQLFTGMLAEDAPDMGDPLVRRMLQMPATVLSSTLRGPLDWPGGVSLEVGDAREVVARLKEESDVPLRSHGSLSVNRSLMAAGLVDVVQVTVYPVITGRSGQDHIFTGAEDFDLELLGATTLDGRVQELRYRPTPHR